MKKLLLFLLIAAFMQAINSQDNFCDPSINDEIHDYMNDNPNWLKDLNVHLEKCAVNNPVEQKFAIILSKGNYYRFVVKNSPKFQGKMKLTLTDRDRKDLLSALTKDNNPKAFDIPVKTTGAYTLKVTYPNGEEGCGAIAIYFVKTMDEKK